MLIVESQSLDVYRNLAIEEYLMDRVADRGPVLFLWRSACAVVVGKNQNPWRECRLDLMQDEGVPLARRISGGGTVYHDSGNLNYCVIVDRLRYREEQVYEMVLQALETFGIRAGKTGKSNLSVEGRKFSGNAFSFRKGRALHHGTLLLNTDLERLNRYLGSMFERIDTHAIASVPAAVANLGLDMEAVSGALKNGFQSLYGDGDMFQWLEADLDAAVLNTLLERQVSDDWKYGATPRFSLETNGLRMEVARGMVENGEYKGKLFRDVAFSLFC
jgi:lipoate---protein ligase